jgi:hypothetical protein
MDEWVQLVWNQQLMAAFRTDVFAQAVPVGQSFKSMAHRKTRQDVANVRMCPIRCQAMPQAGAAFPGRRFVPDQGA